MSKLEPKNPIDGWQFTTPEELLAASKVVAQEGFEGEIKWYFDKPTGTLIWRMSIQVPRLGEAQHVYLTPPFQPTMTTWLVYDSETPRSFTEEDFDVKYVVVPE